MGMMTIAVKDRASPTKVHTHRVYDLKVNDEGTIVADKAGDNDTKIHIDPDLFFGIVNTFDWGGPSDV